MIVSLNSRGIWCPYFCSSPTTSDNFYWEIAHDSRSERLNFHGLFLALFCRPLVDISVCCIVRTYQHLAPTTGRCIPVIRHLFFWMGLNLNGISASFATPFNTTSIRNTSSSGTCITDPIGDRADKNWGQHTNREDTKVQKRL